MTRRLLTVLAVGVGCFLGTATPSLAQPDVAEILAAQQVYRAPGAVAYFDEARVRAALPPDVRILVLPPGGLGADAEARLDSWAKDNAVKLITVDGLSVSGGGEGTAVAPPRTLALLRQATAHFDVTHSVLAAVQGSLDTGVVPTPPVQPTAAQVAGVAARLRDNPVYNAPGRVDPINPAVVAGRGFAVRVAAFPVVPPGARVVDYAPALAKRFSGDVILVAHGRWLDVAGPHQAQAQSARNYAYGRQERQPADLSTTMTQTVDAVVARLDVLVRATRLGEPQPSWQPSYFRRSLTAMVPWVLVGSAAAFTGVVLVGWRRRRNRDAAAEQRALRVAAGSAMARIGELSAELLATENVGQPASPQAAERLATARALYDQAVTAKAMREVAKIAREGLALLRPRPKKLGRRRRTPLPSDPVTHPGDIVVGGLIVTFGVFVALMMLGAVTDEPRPDISDTAEEVAADLRHDPVYVAPDARRGVDPRRVRELIGDRPVVVAHVGGSAEGLCVDLASVRVTDVVIAFEVTPDNKFNGTVCIGDDYGTPGFHFDDVWDEAATASFYRANFDDQFLGLEQLVFAYDGVAVRTHDPGRVPRRALVAPPSPGDKTVLWTFLLVGGTPLLGGILIMLLRRSGKILITRGGRVTAGRTRAAEADARLNRLADAVLHPPQPKDAAAARRQADLAGRYVLILRDYEKTDVAERLTELEQEVSR